MLKSVEEYPKHKPNMKSSAPAAEPEPKSMVYKAIEKVTKSVDRHVESGKTTASSNKQQPNGINIAGENIGAVMEIVDSKREGGHIIKKDKKTKGSKEQKALNSVPSTTFLNTNFQSVNNSVIFDASLAHRDPGLHLGFSHNPTGDRFSVDDKKKQHKNY